MELRKLYMVSYSENHSSLLSEWQVTEHAGERLDTSKHTDKILDEEDEGPPTKRPRMFSEGVNAIRWPSLHTQTFRL